MLSKELIKELQAIIKQDYKREINFSDVALLANNLVGVFDLLAKLNHRANLNFNHKDHEKKDNRQKKKREIHD